MRGGANRASIARMTAPPAHAPRRPRETPTGAKPAGAHPVVGQYDVARADIVTASDLVRHFGLWQERAARTPVYVMFRGRPRLVLTSIEVMETLVAPHVPDRAVQAPDATALLDLVRDMIVIAGADLRITATSRTARAYFGEAVAPGLSLDTLVPIPSREALMKTLRHVVAAGVSQTIDLPSPRRIGGILTLHLDPHRHGVAARIEDITAPAPPAASPVATCPALPLKDA